MQSLRNALLAGCAVFALAGAAQAQTPGAHVMTIRLPGGGISQIEYTGNIPPRIYFGDAPVTRAASGEAPVVVAESPFAMMERISAEMDREMAALWQRTAVLAALPASAGPMVTEAALRNLPVGTQGYSYIAAVSGDGVCSRSFEITSTGNGAPKVVSHTSGNCASRPEGGAAGIVSVPSPSAPVKRPDLLWTKNQARLPYSGIVHEAALR